MMSHKFEFVAVDAVWEMGRCCEVLNSSGAPAKATGVKKRGKYLGI